MTTRDFELIQEDLRKMNAIPLMEHIFVNYESVIKVLHSHLHPEDQDAYKMDDVRRFVKQKDTHE